MEAAHPAAHSPVNSTVLPVIVHAVGTVRRVHIVVGAPVIGYIYAFEGMMIMIDPSAGIRCRTVRLIRMITLSPTVVMPFDLVISTLASGNTPGLAV